MKMDEQDDVVQGKVENNFLLLYMEENDILIEELINQVVEAFIMN